MARILAAGEGLSRSDFYQAYPEDIEADDKENGRYSTGDVSDMERTLRADGQLQPVVCQRLPDGKVKLIAGFRRRLAAIKINDAGGIDGERFKLKFVLWDKPVDRLQALRMNVRENFDRKNLTVMDIAHDIQEFRQLGLTNEQIGDIFNGRSAGWVTQMAKPMKLEPNIQELVQLGPKRGGISADLAFLLADMEPAERKQTLEDAISEARKGHRTRGPVKLTRSSVVKAARKSKAIKGSRSRSAREIKEFWLDWRKGAQRGSRSWKVGTANLMFIAGKIDPEQMEAHMRKALAG